MKNERRPTPASMDAWLEEIAAAYMDAAEAIAFGPLAGQEIKPGDLFHTAPAVCLKFRGLGRSPKLMKRVTEGALSSYVVNQEQHPDVFSSPQLAFAFVFLASHFALDLLEGQEVEAIMDYVEAHRAELVKMMEGR